ncbi:abc transporter g family member 40 [Quercus suber]|uniref:Abc transporter g family member 40 n=1 Tax=Quercus suber TaxID=58331 RepID=A0AAW0K6R3_QUESU
MLGKAFFNLAMLSMWEQLQICPVREAKWIPSLSTARTTSPPVVLPPTSTVSALIDTDSHSWKVDLIRHEFLPHEANMILGIPLRDHIIPDKLMFVEEVMELVELKPLRQALVGLPSENGLSTEQRKRLTIAVELVANPSIIFMDEPTSGLDARAAAIVMRTVRNTVDTGRTVVCTIHQPSIDIFEAFDEGIEGVSKIKDGYNPATWMLEVTSSANETALGIDFANVYRNSELYRRNKELIEQLSIPVPGSKELYFPTQYSQSYFTQFMACLWKQHWSYWRNPLYTFVRFFFTTS